MGGRKAFGGGEKGEDREVAELGGERARTRGGSSPGGDWGQWQMLLNPIPRPQRLTWVSLVLHPLNSGGRCE